MIDVWEVAWFTTLAALGATILALPPGLAVAWLLARRRFRGKALLETIVTLPLVMPPVATGLILLRAFGREGPIGRLLAPLGIEVIFTWKAVVLAMALIGLPLLVRTARAGFEQIDRRYEQIAATLGARPGRVFFTVSLPLAARPVLAGAVLAFARALGEFGATIMVAGSIPGQTMTLATGIYMLTDIGQDAAAGRLLLVSVIIAFAAVWTSNVLTADRSRSRWS